MNHTVSDRIAPEYGSGGSTTGRTGSMTGRATETVDYAINTAEQAVRRVTEHAEEATEQVQAVAGNMRSAIDKSLRDQPMTTLLLAGAVGFVLGALWKT